MYAGRMVEGGDSETVTQNPAHPYTRLLIDSAPDPDRSPAAAPAASRGGRGEPPSLIRPAARLPVQPALPARDGTAAGPSCPPKFEIGDAPGHWAACWLYDADTEPATTAVAATPGDPAPEAAAR